MAVKKEECLRILKDLKSEIQMLEWDEDYYGSGRHSAEEQLAWTMDRLDAVIEIVKTSDLP